VIAKKKEKKVKTKKPVAIEQQRKNYVPTVKDLRRGRLPNNSEDEIKFNHALADPDVQKMIVIDQ